MESLNFYRIRISILFIINFFGIIFYFQHLNMPPLQLTYGSLISGMFLSIFLLLPSLIPLFFKNKIMRWMTLILGVIVTLIDIIIGVGYIIDQQTAFGVIITFFWGIIGVLAIYLSYKWVKSN